MEQIGLVETGGTIGSRSSQGGCRLEDRYRLEDGVFVRRAPVRIFSEDAGPNDWISIARAVEDLAREDVRACLVLHGTDTMAWTGAFLSYALQELRFPIVLTGSTIPGHDPNSDAPRNIADGLLAAKQLPAGVYVSFAGADGRGYVYPGSRVRKTRVISSQGPFVCPASTPLAVIEDGHLSLLREVPRVRGVSRPISWRPVRWLRMFPGQPLPQDPVTEKSILLELYPSATAPRELAGFLEANGDREIFSVTPDGRPFSHLYPSGEFLGKTTALAITPESAYAKIGWAEGADDCVELVSRDLCGETLAI